MIWEIFEKKYISNEVNYICKNINSFNQLYTLLYDEESKSVLENLLNYRLTRMSKYLKPYCNRQKDLYFDEEIIGKDINVYIDGGVFDGETVKRYIDYVNGNYSKIYCFEAEPESINRTKTFINVNGVKNIELIENALWDQKAALRFKLSGAGGSRVIGQGDNSIEVQAISLDSLCLDKCDFIKLDIEGAEEKALIGMKDTIQRLHPNLAISVYHKQDDLINISRIVRKMYPQYKLYLRQYISAPVDTVLYAII